ncbi:hypothetical protein [Robertmurraya massiliosenegalensis]|uniref:hypothetical protein n=1 Tax=Robertmurraya massiliosenegalensis TaxID=1287657 RepID=UPI0002FDD30C|nr:hypothetical protein [Robertmurraya massiliosenegalensis]
MELVSLRRFGAIFRILGWISIFTGLFTLFLINMEFLTDGAIGFGHFFSLLTTITIVASVFSLFSKTSAALGKWGISLGLFNLIFIGAIFLLSWMVNPFP